MTEENKPDYGPVPYRGIQIIEEDCGRFVRYCDPAEFGIVVKPTKPRQSVEAPVDQAEQSAAERTCKKTKRIYPAIIEEDCGRFVRFCDPAEFGINLKNEKPADPRVPKYPKAIVEHPKP